MPKKREKLRIRKKRRIKSKLYQLKFNSKIVSTFLKSFCGHNAKFKYLPEIIWKSPNEFQTNVLSSILVGDGCINSINVRLQLVNKNLIEQIKILSSTLGMSTSYNMRIMKNTGNEAPKIEWSNVNSYNNIIDILNNNHKFIKERNYKIRVKIFSFNRFYLHMCI